MSQFSRVLEQVNPSSFVRSSARVKYGERRASACAGTNNAAKNIGGVTLNSLFGAKITWERSSAGVSKHLSSNPGLKSALSGINVLIIDEISAVKAGFLESIDAVMRKLVLIDWLTGLPFGGLLIIFSGDQLQMGSVFLNHEIAVNSDIDSRPWDHSFGPDSGGVLGLLPQNHRPGIRFKFVQHSVQISIRETGG